MGAADAKAPLSTTSTVVLIRIETRSVSSLRSSLSIHITCNLSLEAANTRQTLYTNTRQELHSNSLPADCAVLSSV